MLPGSVDGIAEPQCPVVGGAPKASVRVLQIGETEPESPFDIVVQALARVMLDLGGGKGDHRSGSSSFLTDSDADRFEREAQVLARLNHPNIA